MKKNFETVNQKNSQKRKNVTFDLTPHVQRFTDNENLNPLRKKVLNKSKTKCRIPQESIDKLQERSKARLEINIPKQEKEEATKQDIDTTSYLGTKLSQTSKNESLKDQRLFTELQSDWPHFDELKLPYEAEVLGDWAVTNPFY